MLARMRWELRRRVIALLSKMPPLLRAVLALRAALGIRSKAPPAASPHGPAPSFAFPSLLSALDFVALDVGAALWLPAHWRLYEDTFDFVLVEPDPAACRELEARAARQPRGTAYFRIVQAALSGKGGVRPFYRTNQPTGSSMLKPAVMEDNDRALFDFPGAADSSDYVFPVTASQVETTTLSQVLKRTGAPGFHMIKLDTQGTELEIVQGLGDALENTVLVQMETGDHGFYLGKTGLAETLAFMNAQGFRLFDLQLARNELPLRGSARGYSENLFPSTPGRDPAFVARLWEVDAVFVRDPIAAIEARDRDTLRRIIVALCVYRLFGEAFQLTGLGEMNGLWNAATASRFRRDIVACHSALRQKLDDGYRLYWERL